MCSLPATQLYSSWYIYRTAPLLRPPPFATYFQEKEGGGRNNEDLHFRLAVDYFFMP